MHTNPELKTKIEAALQQLRPYLQSDGGDVSFVKVTEDMKVLLKLHGACSTCSMSMMTLKAGIEQAILKAVPEITAVESITNDAYEAMQLENGL